MLKYLAILFYFLRNHHQCIYLRGKGSYLIRNFQLDRTRDTHLPNIWVFTTAQVAISCTGGVTMKPTSIWQGGRILSSHRWLLKGDHTLFTKQESEAPRWAAGWELGLTRGLWMGAGIWPHEPLLIQPQAPRAILWPPARGRLGKSAK